MRVSRRVTAAIVVAMTLMSTLPVHAAEPTRVPVGVDATLVARLSTNTGPPAVEGQLLDAAGRPTDGMIEAFAWPSQKALSKIKVGDAVQRVPVSAALAGPDGSFSLRIDASMLPKGYLSSRGQIDLELIAWSATGQQRWFTSVRADSTGGRRTWVATLSDAPRKPDRASIRLSQPLVVASQDPAPQLGIPICPPATLVSTHRVNTLLGRSMMNESGQQSWMFTADGHSMTLGVATSASSTVGYSLSGSATTTVGFDFQWAKSGSDRRYYKEVEYGKYRLTCAGQQSYTFKPRAATGGATSTLASLNPTWTNCAAISAGQWSRTRSDGTATSFSAGVEAAGAIGINLSFASNYSSTRTLNYQLSQSGRVCGNNNLPALAGEVEAES